MARLGPERLDYLRRLWMVNDRGMSAWRKDAATGNTSVIHPLVYRHPVTGAQVRPDRAPCALELVPRADAHRAPGHDARVHGGLRQRERA